MTRAPHLPAVSAMAAPALATLFALAMEVAFLLLRTMASRHPLPSTPTWPVTGQRGLPEAKKSPPVPEGAGNKRAAQAQAVAPSAQKVRHTTQDSHTKAHTRSPHTHTTVRNRVLLTVLLAAGMNNAKAQHKAHSQRTHTNAHSAETQHKINTIHCTALHTLTCHSSGSTLAASMDADQGGFWFGAQHHPTRARARTHRTKPNRTAPHRTAPG